MNNAFHVHFLCRNQRKSLLQVKTHLVAETAPRTRAGAVGLLYTRIENMLKKVEVLVHGCKLGKRGMVSSG